MKKIIFLFLSIITLSWTACENENCYPVECEVQPPTDDPCDGIFQEWFYNITTNTCELIEYSGCGGHGFETQAACEVCICNPTTPESELAGEWNLTFVSCECAPTSLNLGESIWTFDTTNDQLTVQNTVPTQENMLDSGTYEVVVDETNNTMSDIFDIMCDYHFEDDGNTLIIGCRIEVDGPKFTLIK